MNCFKNGFIIDFIYDSFILEFACNRYIMEFVKNDFIMEFGKKLYCWSKLQGLEEHKMVILSIHL